MAARCNYCSSENIRTVFFPELRGKVVHKEKVTPPPGSMDMNIYKKRTVEISSTQTSRYICDSCGSIWRYDSGGVDNEGQCRDHEIKYIALESLNEQRREWQKTASIPEIEIRINFNDQYGYRNWRVLASEVDLDRCLTWDYWVEFDCQKRRKESFLGRLFGG